MEVHAHTHTARKKWTHYFWEFLMLFLAVFCGFLAEYQLEHTIEKQRERQYMKTLKDDLVADTLNYNNSLDFWRKLEKNISNNRALVKPPVVDSNIDKVYRLAAKLMNADEFLYNDRTIEQLRNSGNFRLIHNAEVSENLIQYDSYIRNTLRSQEKVSKDILLNLMHIQNEIFDSEVLESYLIDENENVGSTIRDKRTIHELHDNKIVFKYYNELFLYRVIVLYLINTEVILKKKAIDLIGLINNNYTLK
jgi:hypothetical protein